MRVFSCFVRHRRSSTPILSFVLARDEQRARALARRQLADTPDALAIEIFENDQLIAVMSAEGARS
jgi:hypothetical protein